MSNYYKYLRGKVDLSSIGFTQTEINIPCFCTPKNAHIIGWAGADGIHYCAIRGFGEMIFVVDPTDFGGKYVYPIAHNLKSFISILAYYGDVFFVNRLSSLKEDETKNLIYRNDNIISELKKYVRLTEFEDPYSYVRNLQDNFDYSKIQFSEEFYDLDMNFDAPKIEKEWKVVFDGDFYHNKGRGAKEIKINKFFNWKDEFWNIPSVYVCSKGIIIDYCVSVDTKKIEEFVKEINESEEIKENPLDIDFRFKLNVNGKELNSYSGSSISYIPEDLLTNDVRNSLEAEYVVSHYNLDKSQAWSIHRYSAPWVTKNKPNIKSLRLELMREAVLLSAGKFETPYFENTFEIEHPLNKDKYRINIIDIKNEEFPRNAFTDNELEFPKNYKMLKYEIYPDISDKDFYIRDTKQNEQPKRVNENRFSPDSSYASAIAIIGGADGPTAVFVTSKPKTNELHTAMSALTFEPQEKATWECVFREKLYEDIEISLI